MRSLIARDGGEPERLAGDRAGAGQHDVGDVEGAEHRRQRRAEVLAGAAEDGRAVAGFGLEAALEQRLGDLGLEAAALAARAARAVGVDDDVADLAGGERRAGVEAPVEHEPGADALVDADADQVGRRLLAERQLGEGGGVGVVDDARPGGRTGPRGRRRAGRSVQPRWAAVAIDAVVVDDAGAGDADAEQRPLGVGDQLAADPADEVGGGPAGLALAVVGAADDDLAGEVDEGPDEVRPARRGRGRARGGRRRRRRRASPACRRRPSCSARAPRRRRRPSGRGRPTDTDARVSPVIFARSARDSGPSRCKRPQQVAAVRPPGIFRRRHPIRLFSRQTNPLSSRPPYARSAWSFTAIPVVDLGRWHGDGGERAALADEVREICHEVGFFQLVGHGVPDRVPRATTSSCCRRSSPCPRTSRPASTSGGHAHFRGWERVGAELTDNRTDYREQLDVSTEHPPLPRRRRAAVPAPRRAQPVAARGRAARLPRRGRGVLRPHGRGRRAS